MAESFVLRNARRLGGATADIAVGGGLVLSSSPVGVAEVDLDGSFVLPALINAHDHLDFSTLPPLGRPPYPNAAAWALEAFADSDALRGPLGVPLVDRLFLGGMRNLFSGASAVVHHGPFHRSLARLDFPVRVLEKYSFALHVGPGVKKTYRTTDRRIPWLIHVAEGTDEAAGKELAELEEQRLLRQNTVLIHGISLSPGDGPRLAEAKSALVWCPESNLRLYGRTAPVAALSRAGMAIGLGSDSAATGSRDILSTLAVAHRQKTFEPDALFSLATEGSARVARLPAGGTEPGAPADLLVVQSLERLFSGDRSCLRLVVVGGKALLGEVDILGRLGVGSGPVTLDGAPRGLEKRLHRRMAGIQFPRGASWREGLDLS